MRPDPTLPRLAGVLAAAWQAQAGRVPDVTTDRLDRAVAAVRRAGHRLALARRRGFTLAIPRLELELRGALADLAARVAELEGQLTPGGFTAPAPGAWFDELGQIEEEFGRLTVDWRARTIGVVTGPVHLDGVDLGPFAVAFDWGRAGRSSAADGFTITALAPHRAAGRREVVHPHVLDGRLCAGDAAGPLDRAVRSGRLADAFLLVRSVLTTYNAGSPYAPLEEWDGVSCSDCGRVVTDDDRYSCAGCEDDLCEDCALSCVACSDTRCSGCREPCAVCEDGCCPACLVEVSSGRTVCPGCRKSCEECGTVVATDELEEPGRLCPPCRAAREAGDDPEDSSTPIPTEVPTHAP
jgi:hypothetical protein